MSQVFPKSANAWSKASIIALVLVLIGVGNVVLLLQRSDFVTSANNFVEQPVQFSHQHHAGGIGIECRYCHTSVEVSPSAGIPPTKTCINCHSQIWNTSPYLEPVRASFRDDRPLNWIRIHDLPDFVYFNHSVHVGNGVGCETCHGRVDRMPLMIQKASLQMEWCLDCHRDPTRFLRPLDQITTMGYVPATSQQELGAQLV
ncbi:MAG TPA: cytochrome c3 family protein, partial [Vicinamibacterales bacterium]